MSGPGPGSVIAGRYALDHEIGRGGMGAVWLARDEVLGRRVALKRLGHLVGTTGGPAGPVGVATPDTRRAEREARLAAQLNHQHVVGVFDLVEQGTDQWLVMEYVDGTDLGALIHGHGALPSEQVAPILAQAADALAAAHAAGIVHRDVKPSNILVAPDGQVKLTDFGIARTQADAGLTQTGLVTGSPAYLSPEVASGQLATPASDMWSLGATAFHAVAGSPPYDVGDNVLGALYRIVHEPPPRPPDAGWLTPLLERTMTPRPADRWDAVTVRGFLERGPQVAPLPRPAAATQLLRPVVAPPPLRAPSTPREPALALAPTPAPPAGPAVRRRPGWFLVSLAVAVIVLLAVIAFAIGLNGGGDPSSGPGGSRTSSGAGPHSSDQSASQPTEQGMVDFITSYLGTAASDQQAGFAMLTPAYQAQSGGLSGYSAFWSRVSNPQVLSITADPGALSVDYTYRYELRGKGRQQEEVRLRLSFEGGRYLIAGEA